MFCFSFTGFTILPQLGKSWLWLFIVRWFKSKEGKLQNSKSVWWEMGNSEAICLLLVIILINNHQTACVWLAIYLFLVLSVLREAGGGERENYHNSNRLIKWDGAAEMFTVTVITWERVRGGGLFRPNTPETSIKLPLTGKLLFAVNKQLHVSQQSALKW